MTGRMMLVLLAGYLAACSGSEAVGPDAAHQDDATAPAETAPAGADPANPAPAKEKLPVAPTDPKQLPYAGGQTFATLDAYLAHLKKRGATDVPWYREVEPGIYELVSRRGPGAQPKRYTRAELLEKFGFAE